MRPRAAECDGFAPVIVDLRDGGLEALLNNCGQVMYIKTGIA
jgi:hypothetical protein